MGGLGPASLQAGDRLPVGAKPTDPVSGAVAVPRPAVAELRIVPGPRADWFVPKALQTLLDATWIIQPDSDRVGVRLDGPSLRRAVPRELPSEGTLPGAVQVPPDGRPILLGPDAPVTGGYPVLAVVRDADLDAAFQRRPGQTLRFALKAP
jgi:allophanate hydrolase subunit 2